MYKSSLFSEKFIIKNSKSFEKVDQLNLKKLLN